MGASGLGVKRISKATSTVSLDGMERSCRSFWLDSGAHSLYNAYVLGRSKSIRHNWYKSKSGKFSKNFKSYLDRYAAFVNKYKSGIDYYANVDVIYNPELSWKALKYLEEEHGLNPVPVIHSRTTLNWIDKHIEAGYKYIGLGGLGQESTKSEYYIWADNVFNLICQGKDKLPYIRTHGFAMTSHELLIRYPWWSVDSTSAFKVAGNGNIYVPHLRKGKFTFAISPFIIGVSHRSSALSEKDKHYDRLPKRHQKIVDKWLKIIDVPLGIMGDNSKVIEYGVKSEYNARAATNLRYFQKLCDALPKWPWPFKVKATEGFFPIRDLT